MSVSVSVTLILALTVADRDTDADTNTCNYVLSDTNTGSDTHTERVSMLCVYCVSSMM